MSIFETIIVIFTAMGFILALITFDGQIFQKKIATLV